MKKIMPLLSSVVSFFAIVNHTKASFDGTNFTADAAVTAFVTNADITISNASYSDIAYSGSAILIISNSSSSGITVNWAAAGSALGAETTNQLSLPAGQFVVYTINTCYAGLHTYETRFPRSMPPLPGGGGGGGGTNGAGNGDYITNGLVLYYKLNDGSGSTAVDSSGSGFNLSLIGSPTWESNFLTLNGSSQYGDAGTNAGEINYQDMSISAWVKKTDYSYKSIIDKSFDISGVGSGGWGLRLQADGHPVFWGLQACVDAGTQVVSTNDWTFVTAVWHYSTQGADFYLNGILNSTAHNSSTANYPTYGLADLQVGNMQDNLASGTYAFDGSIRDVGVYNRALSAAEVKTNYLATECNTNVSYPDLMYLKMSEGLSNETNATLQLADSSTLADTNDILYYPYSVIWNTNVAGYSNALHFNGVSTYVDTHTNAYNFTTNLFTINVWLQPLTAGTFLMANGYYHSNGWFLYVGGSYQVIFGAETPGTETAVVTGAGAANEGAWTMVTLVRTDATTVLVYINGIQAATTGSFTTPGSSTNSLILGGNKEGTSWFDGNMCQPQIWGSALSEKDVANLYFNQLKGVAWP